MPKALKVFGITLVRRNSKFSSMHGQVRAFVAATSRAEAGRLFVTSTNHMREFGSETGNTYEVLQAKSKPGTVFLREINMNKTACEEDVCQG